MFMKFEKEKANKGNSMFGPITEGDYEMFVEKAEYRPKKQGKIKTNNINLTLVIRSDVDQEFKGRKVFNTFWFSEETPEKAETCENMFMAFLDKIGTPEGTDFGTPQEAAAYLIAKPIKGHVKMETNDYNQKENPEIKYFNVSDLFGEEVDVEAAGAKKKNESLEKTSKKETTYTRVDDDPFANDGKTIDISDDDLPF